MGRIQQYDQQRLASSVVGTPGVDSSGQKMFNTVANSLEPIQGQLMAEARQNQYEYLQKQKEQERAAKLLKKGQDDLETSRRVLEIDTVLGDKARGYQEAGQHDPTRTQADFEKEGLGYIKTYVEGISEPEVKQAVEIQANSVLRENIGKMQTWSSNQRTANAVAGIEEDSRKLENLAGNARNFKEFQDALTKADNLYSTSGWVLGEKTDKELAKTKSNMAKQYIESLFITDWKMVKPTVRDKAFQSLLNADDRADFIKQVDTIYNKVEAEKRLEQNLADKVETSRGHEQSTDIVINPDIPVPNKIKQLRQMAQGARLTGNLKEAKIYNDEANALAREDRAEENRAKALDAKTLKQNYTKYQTRYMAINNKWMESGPSDKKRDDASLIKNMASLKTDLTRAVRAGEIDENDYQKGLTGINAVLNLHKPKEKNAAREFVKNTVKNVGDFIQHFGQAGVPDKKVQQRMAQETNERYEAILRTIEAKGTKITPEIRNRAKKKAQDMTKDAHRRR